jgi:hypothetical protein
MEEGRLSSMHVFSLQEAVRDSIQTWEKDRVVLKVGRSSPSAT